MTTEHTEAAKDKVAVCPLCEQGHKPTRTSKQVETPNLQEVDYQKVETKIGAAVATDITAMKFDAAVMKSAMLFSESEKKKQQYKDTVAPEPTADVWINVLRKKRAQLAVIADWSLSAGLGSICAYIRPALRSLDNEIVRLEKLLEPKPPVGDLQHGTGADPRTGIDEVVSLAVETDKEKQFYKEQEAPKPPVGCWEVKEDSPSDGGGFYRVRWSIPDDQGRYLWVRHYGWDKVGDDPSKVWCEQAASRDASRFNKEGKRPEEFFTPGRSV